MDEKYLIEGQTLTDIADAIREKTEKIDGIAPENMPEEIRSIDTQEDLTEEISEQDSLIASMLAAVASKATPSLPELENPGTAGDLIEGKQLIDGEGNVVVGELVYVDTKDATAAAENIDEGFTAYVNEQKIVGTSKKIDTNDATALSTDIIEGKTAYVGGELLTGSLIPIEKGNFSSTSTQAGSGTYFSLTVKENRNYFFLSKVSAGAWYCASTLIDGTFSTIATDGLYNYISGSYSDGVVSFTSRKSSSYGYQTFILEYN